MIEFAARRVYFVLAGGNHSPDLLTEVLGVRPDEMTYEGKVRGISPRRHSEKENSWTIVESGDSAADVTTLVDRLYARLSPLASKIPILRRDGWISVVRVVQYVSAEDEVNAGFVITADMIGFLNRTDTFFEVEVFVDEASDRYE